MNQMVTFDARDVEKFEKTLRELGDKVADKAAKKAAQKGSNVIGSSLRKAAPKRSGQLKHGFKKTKERSGSKGKYVYQYAPDRAKNDVFQKPVKDVGRYGGKKGYAYYPASVEYGFLTSAGGKLKFEPGEKRPTRHVEGQYFARDSFVAAAPSANATMRKILNEELDKAWLTK